MTAPRRPFEKLTENLIIAAIQESNGREPQVVHQALTNAFKKFKEVGRKALSVSEETQGYTPLMVAVSIGNIPAVQWLLEEKNHPGWMGARKGASVSYETKEGESALSLAIAFSDKGDAKAESKEQQPRRELFELIFKADQQYHQKTKVHHWGNSVRKSVAIDDVWPALKIIELAAKAKNFDVIKFLITKYSETFKLLWQECKNEWWLNIYVEQVEIIKLLLTLHNLLRDAVIDNNNDMLQFLVTTFDPEIWHRRYFNPNTTALFRDGACTNRALFNKCIDNGNLEGARILINAKVFAPQHESCFMVPEGRPGVFNSHQLSYFQEILTAIQNQKISIDDAIVFLKELNDNTKICYQAQDIEALYALKPSKARKQEIETLIVNKLEFFYYEDNEAFLNKLLSKMNANLFKLVCKKLLEAHQKIKSDKVIIKIQHSGFITNVPKNPIPALTNIFHKAVQDGEIEKVKFLMNLISELTSGKHNPFLPYPNEAGALKVKEFVADRSRMENLLRLHSQVCVSLDPAQRKGALAFAQQLIKEMPSEDGMFYVSWLKGQTQFESVKTAFCQLEFKAQEDPSAPVIKEDERKVPAPSSTKFADIDINPNGPSPIAQQQPQYELKVPQQPVPNAPEMDAREEGEPEVLNQGEPAIEEDQDPGFENQIEGQEDQIEGQPSEIKRPWESEPGMVQISNELPDCAPLPTVYRSDVVPDRVLPSLVDSGETKGSGFVTKFSVFAAGSVGVSEATPEPRQKELAKLASVINFLTNPENIRPGKEREHNSALIAAMELYLSINKPKAAQEFIPVRHP